MRNSLVFKSLSSSVVLALSCQNVIAADAPINDKQSGWFVGGDLGKLNSKIKFDGESYTDKGWTLGALGGYKFNHWFALEGAVSISEDVGDVSGIDVTYNYLSFMPKFTYVISDQFSLYGKAGIATLILSVTDDDEDDFDDIDSLDDTKLGLGLGAEYRFDNGVNVRLGYEMMNADLDGNNGFYDIEAESDFRRLAVAVYFQF